MSTRKESNRDAGRRYRLRHPEKAKASSHKYLSDHSDEIKKRKQNFATEHPDKILYYNAKSRAKKRGSEFSIEPSDIVIPDICPVLGISLLRATNNNQPCDNSPSLDRIDNTEGYIKGNVWVISWRANKIKRHATVDELEKVLVATKNILAIGGKWYPSVLFVRRKDGERYSPIPKILESTKRNARTRGLSHNIEHSDIVIPDTCPILGIPLFKTGGKRTDNSPSIDRIDSSKGYIKGNVWCISWRANVIKNNATIQELELIVSALHSKMKEIAL